MTKPQKRFIAYTAAFLALTVLLVNQSRVRDFFADPLEITAQPVTHILAKDELHFTPAGKCSRWFVWQPEVTLELRSSAGIHRLVLAQQIWATNSPLVFKLPVPYSDVNSFSLRGGYFIVGTVKLDPNGKFPLDDGTRLDITPIGGYKIDSSWTTK